MKTNKGLVEYAKAQLGKPYWYGTFGQLGTKSLYEQKKRQYPGNYKFVYNPATATKQVFDCVGLIKAYLWCDSISDTTPTYNASQDKSANGMYSACKTKGPINTIPDMPGVLVFMNGHVGIYIGNGEVIEAAGYSTGVVKTQLSRGSWKNWGLCPYITYEEEKKPEPAPTTNKVVIELTQLTKGMKGNEVKTLQRLLLALGYSMNGYGADGSFGGATRNAVIAFQKAKGLDADGIVGTQTWTALLK